MINFRIAEKDLIAAIDAAHPKWLEKAAQRTRAAIAAGKVAEGDGIWSEIKRVYMELQGFKCMYCEKPMPASDDGSGAEGKVEYDVEHFRPKNRAAKWPTADVKALRNIDYDAQLSAGVASGYLWLAFDPLNYGVSCKTCNSELKGDRFPLLGTVGSAGANGPTLDKTEKPGLILPLFDTSDDPEAYLQWTGPLVRPRAGLSAADTLRARVIIDFFQLDTRRDLVEQRCRAIALIAPKLPKRATSPKAKRFVEALTADGAVWAGCLRAFVKLFDTDQAEAEDWLEHCEDYIATKS